VSSPEAGENEHRINYPEISLPSAPNFVIVTELSKYFLSRKDLAPTSTPNISSYLTLLNRILVLLGNIKGFSAVSPPKFVLFDSHLDAFKLPISSHVEELPSHHPRQTPALPLIANYFEWIGAFEDDSSYVPSSQGEETASDEGIHKQLRVYRSGEAEDSDNDIQIYQWVETRRSLPGGCEATDFLWTTPNP